jgi:hypothetical protein
VSGRGIYTVAFGEPARACAARLIRSIRQHMPGIPVALCGVRPLGIEDVFVEAEDTDVGGRRAKLRAFELAPPEWDAVLYLDADTELVAPIGALFGWIEDGWEFVICRDVKETLHWFQRRNNLDEFEHVRQVMGTLWALQYNGGVWAFRRCEAARRLLERWLAEWEIYGQRDQGALVRALHAAPLRMLVLCNEWNHCGPRYTPQCAEGAIRHRPGQARRWAGKIPGRIDSREAWRIVRRWEAAHL